MGLNAIPWCDACIYLRTAPSDTLCEECHTGSEESQLYKGVAWTVSKDNWLILLTHRILTVLAGAQATCSAPQGSQSDAGKLAVVQYSFLWRGGKPVKEGGIPKRRGSIPQVLLFIPADWQRQSSSSSDIPGLQIGWGKESEFSNGFAPNKGHAPILRSLGSWDVGVGFSVRPFLGIKRALHLVCALLSQEQEGKRKLWSAHQGIADEPNLHNLPRSLHGKLWYGIALHVLCQVSGIDTTFLM